MMCQHCVAHVEKALTALGGVSAAQADLEGKCATVTLSAPVSDEELKERSPPPATRWWASQ